MSRYSGIMLIVIILLTSYSQYTINAQSINIETDASIFFCKNKINISEIELYAKEMPFSFSFIAERPNWYKLKYSVQNGFRNQTLFDAKTMPFKIGDTEFGKTKNNTKETEPVLIEWTIPISHLFELSLGEYFLKPFFIAETTGFQIEASTKKDNEIITDKESYKRFFYGVGGDLTLIFPQSRMNCKAAFGDRYNFFEAFIAYRISQGLHMQGGYLYKKNKFPGGPTIQSDGPFISLNYTF